MPFTLSHAAAALPLQHVLRRYCSVSGLVIGSFAPDTPYFVSVGVRPGQTHTLIGAVTWSLAFGMIAWLLYQLLIRPALAPALPSPLRRRLPLSFAQVQLPREPISIVALSVALGALTHVFWDSFTHARAVATWGEAFGNLVTLPGGLSAPLFKWLQYGGGVCGLLVIMAYVLAWWRRSSPREDSVRPYPAPWPAVIGLAVIALPMLFGVAMGVLRASSLPDANALNVFLVSGAFAGLTAGVAALLGTSIAALAARRFSVRR